MKKNCFIAATIIVSFLSSPVLVRAEDKPKTVYPAPEFVSEAQVEGTGVIKVGGKVLHKKFGIGVVKRIQLNDDTKTVNIVFETYGSKWLLAEYANLKVIND